jgi:universal stress protein E
MNVSGPSPVLVVMDPADAPDHALARGARLAGALGLPLELFRVEFDQAMEGSHFRVTERLEAARAARVDASLAWLEDKARPWREQGLEVAVAAEYANPGHEAVTRRALAVGAALVVMRTHHHEWLARATLSAADWQLIRVCPAPLLLAKGRKWPQHTRLLAAVDPSHRDDRHARLDHAILDLAEQLGSALPAEIRVAHCVLGSAALESTAALAMMPDALGAAADDYARELLREARAAVAALLADRSIDEAQLHLIEGRPEQELPRLAAELGADVLLTGGISRSRVEQVFIGGTAERLLDHVDCDLLVVKPPGFRSPLA